MSTINRGIIHLSNGAKCLTFFIIDEIIEVIYIVLEHASRSLSAMAELYLLYKKSVQMANVVLLRCWNFALEF